MGIDLLSPPEVPDRCTFIQADILKLRFNRTRGFYIQDGPTLGFFDAATCSSPCEEFSLFGMPHFHPNPPHPAMGLKLFEHSRNLLIKSGVPFIMENVKAAQNFVGFADGCCGPFFLWGPLVPPLVPMGIKKGIKHAAGFNKNMSAEEKRLCRLNDKMIQSGSKSKARKEYTAKAATIPPELAHCTAEYAERVSA